MGNNNVDEIFNQKVLIMCEKLDEDECATEICGYGDLFDKRYAVTNKARLYSFLQGRFLTPQIGANGYLHHILTDKNGRLHNIELHKIVAHAWCDGYKEGLEVLHIDGTQPLNCLPSNLKWGTHKENCQDPIRNAKISEANSKAIKNLDTGEVFKSGRIASEMTGINRVSISRACRGLQKTAGGSKWCFYEAC